jgi:hypothetical protein
MDYQHLRRIAKSIGAYDDDSEYAVLLVTRHIDLAVFGSEAL